jgi:magnesium-transporting ATPase (P-type)
MGGSRSHLKVACLHGTVTSPIHRQNALWIDTFASGTWAEDTDHVLLGKGIEAMGDDQLADAVKRTTLFARVLPAHKQLDH